LWRIAPESARRVQHPAPFPVELPERLIHLYTYEGDTVLDPFCGSGSTLVAADRTNRRGVGFDTDPDYVALANGRLATPEAKPETAERFAEARAGAKSAGGLAEEALRAAGFEIDGTDVRIKGAGMTVDFVARDRSGRAWYVDVSGAFTVTPSGLAKSEGVWRALGRAALLAARELGPVLLLTSHLPAPGTPQAAALASGAEYFVAAVEIAGAENVARLRELAAGTLP